MGTTPIEASNNNSMYIQLQALDKGRQMETVLKGKLDQKQNFQASWLVTTIKKIIRKPVKELGLPVFSFKRTQETVFHDRNILAAFYGNLGATMDVQK